MSIKEDNILTKAINKKISRRSFIKWSGALGATASMSGLVMQAGSTAALADTSVPAAGVGGSIVKWRPTCCLVCHSWCHIAAGVDANGHIRKIEGCGGQPATYSNGNPVKNLTLTVTGDSQKTGVARPIGSTTANVGAGKATKFLNGMKVTLADVDASASNVGALPLGATSCVPVDPSVFALGMTVTLKGTSGSTTRVLTSATGASPLTWVAPLAAAITGGTLTATAAKQSETVTLTANGAGNGDITFTATTKLINASAKATTNPWSLDSNVVSAALQSKPDDANHIPTPASYLAYAPHNKGRICAKGNDGMEHLYDPDRIKYPLKRVGDRGSGAWQKISWDTALGEIADKLRSMAQAGHKHRLVVWIGRNEHGFPGFSKAYGTPNEIQHTSLCELSRHVAGRSMWGHHWSSVDLQEHTTFSTPTTGPAGMLTLDREIHDIDYYIEWGGNPAEAKIPHSSCATHLGDRRRSNLKGYQKAGVRGGTKVYGRIVTIDVRQSNTAAFSDEYFQIVPGSDGALALWLIREVLRGSGVGTAANATKVRNELEIGHNGGTNGLTNADSGYNPSNRFYYGLFKAEEGGVASGSVAASVPTGKSLEAYLFNNGAADGSFAAHLGVNPAAGGQDALIKAAVQTAVFGSDPDGATKLEHLASVFVDGNGGKFINVVTDGYRGPCKHTNGTYNYRAIRALQLLAPNWSARDYWGTWSSTSATVSTPRGGYNAPGAFQSDKNWDPYNYGGGVPGLGSPSDMPGTTSSVASGLPDDDAVGGSEAAPSDKMRVDNWDYDLDLTRWRGAYKWVDQNLHAGIRHSIGLHAFTQGAPADASKSGPYGTATNEYDTTFKVEALLSHKNAPGYSRPQQDLEIEMLTAQDSNGDYLLENFWSIDICMGDGTRYADIVLPDVSYLERYSGRSGEGQEFNYRDNRFWRVPVYEIENGEKLGTLDGGQWCPRHLYDARSISAIVYQLARKIEPGNTLAKGAVTDVWNGSLYNSFIWDPVADEGGVQANITAGKAYVNDGEWAVRRAHQLATNGQTGKQSQLDMAAKATNIGAADGFDLIRSHGMIWNTKDRPAYWRHNGFEGDGSEAKVGDTFIRNNGYKMKSVKQALQIYNKVLDTMPDVKVGTPTDATKSDGTFFGIPVYRPVLQAVDLPTYPRHLTTYKINVHTQSRTAHMPRLQEIIGNSWAVLPVTSADSEGPYCLADGGSGRKIRNGELVTVESKTGTLECVAKVTEKAQKACVHISHSQGHRVGDYEIDGDPMKYGAAFGRYKVNGVSGRTIDRTLNNPAGSPVDDWVVNVVPPSAPGRGAHPNQVILHHLDTGAGTGDNYATDPIGGSQAWFDTKVKVY